MATERLDIVISQKGGKVVKQDIASIGKEAGLAATGVDKLKRVLGAIGIGLAIREAGRLADSYTTMQNRLKTVTASQEGLNRATEALFGIANRTRNSIEGTVEFYARLSGAAKALGKSQEQLLAITETVNQAVALSGATTSESAGALRQLSQGLGSGTLRGEELNSVLEQLPIIADIIADSLGKTRGELRGLAQDGKLTADVVVAALEGAAGRIGAAFQQSTPTIAQSFIVLKNSLTQYVGELDRATGISRALSETILGLANNLDIVIPLLVAIGGLVAFNFLAAQAAAFSSTVSGLIPLLGRLRAAMLGVAAAQTAAAAGGSASFFAATNALAGGSAAGATTAALGAGLGIAALKITAVVAGAAALVKGLDLAAEGSKELIADFQSGARGLQNMTGEAEKLALVMRSTAENTSLLTRVLGETPPIRNIEAAAAAYAELNREALQAEARRDFGRDLNDTELLAVSRRLVESLQKASLLKDFKLLPDELTGGRASQVASEVAEITKRIADLNEAKRAGAISAKDFGLAMEFQNEKLDKLSGGIEKQLEEVERQIKFFDQAKGDAELSNLFGSNDFEAVLLLKDRREVLARMVEEYKAQGEAAQKVKDIEAQRKASIDATLESLREQNRLFGQTPEQLQLTGLRDAGAGPDVIAQAESLQKQGAILQQFSQIIGGGTALFSEIVAFQEQAAALQQQTATASATVQQEASILLAEGTASIAAASQTLFTQVGSFLKAAADLALSEVQGKFAAGAAAIGTATAQAFSAAFTAGLSGALGSILGSVGASLGGGGGGGVLPGGLAAIGNGGTRNEALERNRQQIAATNDQLTEMIANLKQIGPISSQSFNQGSSAAQQFGNSTVNIGQQINNVFQNAFGGLESALVGFVQTGKLDFKSLINSIIADLARMVIQMLIIRPLMGFFGGIFGGFLGFSGGGFVGGNLPGFATGGIVGGFGGSTSDNHLVRVSSGEFIVNAAATKQNRAALEFTNSTGRMPVLSGGGGGTVFAPTIIVNQQGGGPGDGQATAKEVEAAVKRSFTEMVIKAQRKGGVLDKGR